MPFSPLLLLWDLCVGNNIRLEGAGCEIKGHITMMISIDRQPWAHRGGPAFVTSELNPIADPQRTLMNWPCSPSLFNWWRLLLQVGLHYVLRIYWFAKTHPPFFKDPSTQAKTTPPLLNLVNKQRECPPKSVLFADKHTVLLCWYKGLVTVSIWHLDPPK